MTGKISTPQEASEQRRRALSVLATITLLGLVSRGVGESFAIFLVPISQAFEVDRASLTGIYATYMLAIGLSAPLAGRVLDRLGARWCYQIGLAVFAASTWLAGSATALWQMVLLLGVGGAIGASLLGMVPAAALASRWFDARLPTAMGTISASLGVGILLFAPLAQILIASLGWRGAYHALGAGMVAALALVVLLPWRRLAAGAPAIIQARQARLSRSSPWTLRKALGTHTFWGLFGVMFFTSLSTYALNVQLVAFLVASGLPALHAAAIYGAMGMVSIVGMIGAGVLAERLGEARVAVLSYGATIAGVACLASLSESRVLAPIAGFIALFGTMQGSRGPLVAVLSARKFAGGTQSGIYGGVLVGMGTGGALGAWGSGWLYDLTGAYHGGFALSALGALLGLALFLTLPEVRAPQTGQVRH
jgi:MFS family permease